MLGKYAYNILRLLDFSVVDKKEIKRIILKKKNNADDVSILAD